MSIDISAHRPGFFRWLGIGILRLLQEIRQRPRIFLVLASIWVLALIRVFGSHMPLLPIMFNSTPSLPYTLVYVDYSPGKLKVGDLVVYRFTGEAGHQDYPGLRDQPFFKAIAGLPGDRITVSGRDVYVNGVAAGRAKPFSFDRKPLDPIAPGVIPEGYVYVRGTSADSFDSRYRSSGLVPMSAVHAKVHPIY